MVPFATCMTVFVVLAATCAYSTAQPSVVFQASVDPQATPFITSSLSFHNEKTFTAGVPNVTVTLATSTGAVTVLALDTPAAPDTPSISATWQLTFPAAGTAGGTVFTHSARHVGAYDSGDGKATTPGTPDLLAVLVPSGSAAGAQTQFGAFATTSKQPSVSPPSTMPVWENDFGSVNESVVALDPAVVEYSDDGSVVGALVAGELLR